MTYKLADGSMSTEYGIGDKFVVAAGEDTCFSKGSIVEFIRDDGSECPRFKLIEGVCDYDDGAFEEWKNLKPYKPEPKSLLKDGCWVTYRNGRKRVVIGGKLYNEDEVALTMTNTIMSFMDDLSTKGRSTQDIITIEYMGEVIWQREEETAEQKEIKRLRKVIEEAQAKLKEME